MLKKIFSKKTDLEARLSSLIEKIKKTGIDEPVILLDTGAIIDFEREIEMYRLKDKKISALDFYEGLSNSFGALCVNASVLAETAKHNQHHCINGCSEVSLETFKAIAKMRAIYEDLVRIGTESVCMERARYDTYWASRVAFDLNHKKMASDAMSVDDRETVASAIYLKNMFLPSREDSEKLKIVNGVVILSPDAHINKTVEVLRDENFDAIERVKNYAGNCGRFGYSGIHTINSRKR